MANTVLLIQALGEGRDRSSLPRFNRRTDGDEPPVTTQHLAPIADQEGISR